MNTENTPFKQACDKAGGQAVLAKILGVHASYVNQMANGRRPVPPKYCVKIEKQLGISRKIMLPDEWAEIWPDLVDSAG